MLLHSVVFLHVTKSAISFLKLTPYNSGISTPDFYIHELYLITLFVEQTGRFNLDTFQDVRTDISGLVVKVLYIF